MESRQFEREAKDAFGDLGVTVVSGHRLLKGFIGDADGRRDYIQKKVTTWCDCIEKLSTNGVAAVTKSLQFEWAYYDRVLSGCADAFQPLEELIETKLLPAIFGGGVENKERILFALPARTGGLGLRDPTTTASLACETSRSATKVVTDAIIG